MITRALDGVKGDSMRSRDEIEAILAARCAAMDESHGAHDAGVALRVRDFRGDAELCRELRALANAPRAYLAAYWRTIVASIGADYGVTL